MVAVDVEADHSVWSSMVHFGQAFDGSTTDVAIHPHDWRWATLVVDSLEIVASQRQHSRSVDAQTVAQSSRHGHSFGVAAPESNRLEIPHSIFAATIASVCRHCPL